MSKTFFCIDAHTCGNPVRVVAGGGPPLIGKNMSEKRQHFLREYDWIRKGLMFEPRGHDMMSGSILYPPSDPANDVGVLFIETSGCLPMCGHGTIGTVTIAIEHGLVIPKTPGVLNLEVPAGLVRIEYKQEGKKVKSVKIRNVKAYLAAEGITATCPELGELTLDVSYGGNFYAIVDVQKNFPGLEHFKADQMTPEAFITVAVAATAASLIVRGIRQLVVLTPRQRFEVAMLTGAMFAWTGLYWGAQLGWVPAEEANNYALEPLVVVGLLASDMGRSRSSTLKVFVG
ncbi:MAG: proline racemase family protein, partial [Cyclobacteriaceae bacterium]